MKLKLVTQLIVNTKHKREQDKEQKQKQQIMNKNEIYYADNYVEGKYPFITSMRIRPLSFAEYQLCSIPTIQVVDHESIILKNDQMRGARFLTRDKLFRSNRSFPPGTTNLQLYNSSLSQIIKDAFFGINYSAFYIGSPGSGKTYTCIGTQTDPGTLLYFAKDLFDFKEKEFPLARIYVSIFRFSSDFKDLLAMSDSFIQYRHTKWGPFLPGLSTVRANDLKQFLVFLKIGLKNDGKRDIYKDLNAFNNLKDEKSHFIVKFTILNRVIMPDKDNISNNTSNGNTNKKQQQQQQNFDSSEKQQSFVQKMCTSTIYFIDTESYIRSIKLENKSINNSMQAFNSCIRSLYEINQKIITNNRYVPYDQNKFTNYFKEFLGGKGRCIIIGSLSPCIDHLHDTLRVMKEVNWCLNCTGHCKPNQEIIKDNSGSMRKNILDELPFLNSMKVQVELINQEVKKINYNPTLRLDDCEKQIKSISDVISQLFKIYRELVQKTQQMCFMRDQVNSLNRKIIETEVSVIYQLFRTQNIKEFYFVKVVQLMYSHEVQKQLSLMKHQLVFKLRDLRLQLNCMQSIKKQAFEYLNNLEKKTEISKQTYKELIFNFVENFNTYVQWQLFNSFKSFVNPEKDKLEMLRIKARKQCDQFFKTFITFLQINTNDTQGCITIDSDDDEENEDENYQLEDEDKQQQKEENLQVENSNQKNDKARGSMMSIDFKSLGALKKNNDPDKLQQQQQQVVQPKQQKNKSNNNNNNNNKQNDIQINVITPAQQDNKQPDSNDNEQQQQKQPEQLIPLNNIILNKKSMRPSLIIYKEAVNQKEEEDDDENEEDQEEENQKKLKILQKNYENENESDNNNNFEETQEDKVESHRFQTKKSASMTNLRINNNSEKLIPLDKRDLLDVLKQNTTIKDLVRRELPYMRSRFFTINIQKNRMNVYQKMKVNKKNLDFFCKSPNSSLALSQVPSPNEKSLPNLGQRKFFSVTARDNSEYAKQQQQWGSSRNISNINLSQNDNKNVGMEQSNNNNNNNNNIINNNIFDFSELRICATTREQKQRDLIQNMKNCNLVLKSNFNENLSITLEKKTIILDPINVSESKTSTKKQNQQFLIRSNQNLDQRTSSCCKAISTSRASQEKQNILFSSSLSRKREKSECTTLRLQQFNLENNPNIFLQRTQYRFPKNINKVNKNNNSHNNNNSSTTQSNIKQYANQVLDQINLE